MPDLRSALFSAGLVSENKLKEVEAQKSVDADAAMARVAKMSREREKRLKILKKTTRADQFRRQSLKLLLQYPDMLQEIINIGFSRGVRQRTGGERLIRELLQIRNTLKYQVDPLTRAQMIEFIGAVFPSK